MWLQIGENTFDSRENMRPCERDLSEYSGLWLSLPLPEQPMEKLREKKKKAIIGKFCSHVTRIAKCTEDVEVCKSVAKRVDNGQQVPLRGR